jgi:hypothetical protein
VRTVKNVAVLTLHFDAGFDYVFVRRFRVYAITYAEFRLLRAFDYAPVCDADDCSADAYFVLSFGSKTTKPMVS